MKTKSCEHCNSEIITVKRGNRTSVECSYCGVPYDEVGIEDILPEEYGDYDE